MYQTQAPTKLDPKTKPKELLLYEAKTAKVGEPLAMGIALVGHLRS